MSKRVYEMPDHQVFILTIQSVRHRFCLTTILIETQDVRKNVSTPLIMNFLIYGIIVGFIRNIVAYNNIRAELYGRSNPEAS